MKYLSIIKKQGITTLKALGHITFENISGLFRTYLTFTHLKKNEVLFYTFFFYSLQNKGRASSYLI